MRSVTSEWWTKKLSEVKQWGGVLFCKSNQTDFFFSILKNCQEGTHYTELFCLVLDTPHFMEYIILYSTVGRNSSLTCSTIFLPEPEGAWALVLSCDNPSAALDVPCERNSRSWWKPPCTEESYRHMATQCTINDPDVSPARATDRPKFNTAIKWASSSPKIMPPV